MGSPINIVKTKSVRKDQMPCLLGSFSIERKLVNFFKFESIKIVIDSFKGTIVVPISSNPDYNKKLIVKSPNFPYGRSNPVTSSWNVKVTTIYNNNHLDLSTCPSCCCFEPQVRTNCRRGLVTMKIDELSRLSDEKECSEGFYRVSPFMKQTKYDNLHHW